MLRHRKNNRGMVRYPRALLKKPKPKPSLLERFVLAAIAGAAVTAFGALIRKGCTL